MLNLQENLPVSLEDAIEKLKLFFSKHLVEIENMSEEEFLSSTHFFSGMQIRNAWQLWWSENHGYKEWTTEKPLLNKWFNSIDIYHADDMSSILLTCLYRNIHNLPYNVDSQLIKFKAHWTEAGFKDGIFKNN